MTTTEQQLRVLGTKLVDPWDLFENFREVNQIHLEAAEDVESLEGAFFMTETLQKGTYSFGLVLKHYVHEYTDVWYGNPYMVVYECGGISFLPTNYILAGLWAQGSVPLEKQIVLFDFAKKEAKGNPVNLKKFLGSDVDNKKILSADEGPKRKLDNDADTKEINKLARSEADVESCPADLFESNDSHNDADSKETKLARSERYVESYPDDFFESNDSGDDTKWSCSVVIVVWTHVSIVVSTT